MNGNPGQSCLNLEKQLKAAQEHFDSNRIDAAERALGNYPGLSVREAFPEISTKLIGLRHAIERHHADAYLNANVPTEFRSIDTALYPSPDSLASVLAFQPGPTFEGRPLPGFKGGLLLFGSTGAGKTRAAFARLSAQCYEDHEQKFRYVSAPILKRQLADAARGGRSQQVLEDLLEDSTATLFIDDLSQARFTPAFAENLFELIDRIHREHVALIVTVQTTGSALVRKWCSDDKDLEDTAQAIARRLKEYCHAVRFSPAATVAKKEEYK